MLENLIWIIQHSAKELVACLQLQWVELFDSRFVEMLVHHASVGPPGVGLVSSPGTEFEMITIYRLQRVCVCEINVKRECDGDYVP